MRFNIKAATAQGLARGSVCVAFINADSKIFELVPKPTAEFFESAGANIERTPSLWTLDAHAFIFACSWWLQSSVDIYTAHIYFFWVCC